MNTYNVYIGEAQIMKNIPEGDIKHKLEYLNEYFKHYPDDALRYEEIRVVKNEVTDWQLYNITLWTNWFDRGILTM